MNKKILSILLALFVLFPLAAQKKDASEEDVLTTASKVQIAMSASFYPVTAGDIYTVSFAAGGSAVQYTIPVDSSYKIRVANLGMINCAGLSYLQLKSQVENLVSKNYPLGGVQFVLTSPAVFTVTVTGEVGATKEYYVWALTRLSEVLNQNLTAYSSTRKVSIEGSNGKTKTYDLFVAKRDGNMNEDPFLRPRDKIIVGRYDRKVTISGAVERPGTYELLKGENLKDLVEKYGNGLSEYASTDNIILQRKNNSTNQSGDTVYLSKKDITANTTLENADVITIPSRMEMHEIMFFEGAVGALGREAQTDNSIDAKESNNLINPIINRIPVQFLEGENFATLIRRTRGNFVATSDLRNAYIIRDGENFSINLEDYLYDSTSMSEYTARKNDVLYVPYMQTTSTVLVTGEVTRTAEVDAWPLKRLSTIIENYKTSYSSTRDIEVIGVDGSKKVCDLFMASRYGQMEQNPYIRPGEQIVINRIDRKVTISGAVERPGTYELLEGENLKDLVEEYGNGLSEYASTDNIILQRKNNSTNQSGDTVYLSKKDITANTTLENADVITIPSRMEMHEIMFFEGAVGALGREAQTDNSIDAKESNNLINPIINRIPVQFLEGENFATLIRRTRGNFVATSDLRNAYIIRDGENFSINLEEYLYDSTSMSEYTARKNDVLYVPYMQTTSTVLLTGEVTHTAEVDAWPLKRLSSIISNYKTSYSSTRNIEVIGVDGSKKVYDLFLANRYGQMDQDPYIRPGEQIKVNRMDRKVTISGAVERPGTYELLKGENLRELVEKYGNGLAPLADSSRLEIYRKLVEADTAGEKIYLSQKDLEDNYELLCYDEVKVSTYMDLQPVVFVEGAVKLEDDESTVLSSTTKITAKFTDGEDYAFFVRRNRAWFSAESDLEKAYIIRGNEIISVDLNPMLNDSSYYSDIKLALNDRLIVPFRQFFVSVAGAVVNPGRYPYIPDRQWDYYIGLAGGFIKTQNTGESVTITDIDGKKYSKKENITPETTITANTNSGLYYFNQYAPVITTILSLVASTLSILAVTGVFK